MPIWNFRRHPSTTAASGTAATAHELKAAYEQGRRDERADRKRHPVIMTGLVVLAAVGASLVTLAAVNGSFTGGGEVADQQLAAAASQAAPVMQDAATRTSEAAREAGADLRDKGHSLLGKDAS
jgi:hypothetical protein